MRRNKIIISCGGTGGHTYPGLAVAETLKKRGHRVTVWISGKDIENKTLDSWSGDVVRIHAEGFQFGISWKSLRTLYQLFLGLLSAIPILRRDRPDIILAMGSYSSFAPVAGAIVLRIPYILHEANVIPGRLVSMMTAKAHAIAISFESSRYYIKHPMVVDTGMPLRIDLQRKITTPKEVENNKFCILITGGSRGAKKLNEVIPLALKKLNIQHKFKVIHLIGLNQIEPVKKIYEESKIEAEVLSYVHNIEKCSLSKQSYKCSYQKI